MATDCLFCKISRGEIPCQQQYQDDQVLAFYDINPKAKTHILIIPHKHIPSIMSLEEGDEKIMGHLIRVAQKIGKDLNLVGYRLQFNVGERGGQVVFHVHLHLMAD